jgi:hypothetical protein
MKSLLQDNRCLSSVCAGSAAGTGGRLLSAVHVALRQTLQEHCYLLALLSAVYMLC